MSGNPIWRHVRGDSYLALCWYPQGSLESWRHEVVWHGEVVPTRALAWREGCRYTDSDDFNIAVIRDHRVVAWLWNHEVVDDDEGFLDAITVELSSWVPAAVRVPSDAAPPAVPAHLVSGRVAPARDAAAPNPPQEAVGLRPSAGLPHTPTPTTGTPEEPA